MLALTSHIQMNRSLTFIPTWFNVEYMPCKSMTFSVAVAAISSLVMIVELKTVLMISSTMSATSVFRNVKKLSGAKTVALDEKQPDQSNKKIQPVEKTDNKDENKDHSILSKKSSETDLSKNQKSQLLEQKCRDSQAEFDSLKMQIADLEHQKITLQMELDDLKQQRVKFSKASPDSGIREGRFIIYNNGTIRDLNARLMWAASDNQEDINWFQAVRYVKELQLGGYSDWRLPKMNELEQLFQTGNNNRQPSLGCSGGYGITNGFHLSCDVLWSADRKNDGAYALDFISGKPRYDNPSGSGHRRVLPVRSD